MDKYELGPNGALIIAADLIADQIGTIAKDADDLNPDVLIIGTPRQMELFAFRASGPFHCNRVDKTTQGHSLPFRLLILALSLKLRLQSVSFLSSL